MNTLETYDRDLNWFQQKKVEVINKYNLYVGKIKKLRPKRAKPFSF